MPIRKPKPTSPGRRFVTYADFAEVTKSRPDSFAAQEKLGEYYLKTDPKSLEIRQRFVQHVKKMFQLAGDSAENAWMM